MESVRLSIHDHLTSVGEEILCVVEKQQQRPSDDAWSVKLRVRVFVLERLGVAAEFMWNLFQREMETQQCYSKLHTTTADSLYLPGGEEEVAVEQQESSRIPLQKEPEPLRIKEEQQEELLQRPEEADGSPMTLLAGEGEDDDDENRGTQTLDAYGSMLTTLPAVESEDEDVDNRETEPLEPTSSHCSESDKTEDSDDWEETGEDQSLSNNLSQNLKSSKQTAPMRGRTGRKSFSCSVCGKVFGHKGTLTRHFKRHTGENTFTCEICGKGFGHISNLKRHVRTHTGEEEEVGTFTGAVCEQRFSLSTNLKRHMRTHAAKVKKQQQSSSDGDPVKKKKTRTTTSELQGAFGDGCAGIGAAGMKSPAAQHRKPICLMCFRSYRVASLPGHLKDLHSFKNTEERKIILNLCNKRTNIRLCPCPLPGCGHLGKFLDRHLSGFHRDLTTDEVDSYKEQARRRETERLLRELRDTNPVVPLRTTWDDNDDHVIELSTPLDQP